MGPPDGTIAVVICADCAQWWITTPNADEQGEDATANLTSALEGLAPDQLPEHARAMRGIVESLRESGTGWQ